MMNLWQFYIIRKQIDKYSMVEHERLSKFCCNIVHTEHIVSLWLSGGGGGGVQ